MNILQVNKYNFLAGGSEKYYLGVSKILKKNVHKIAFFSMQSPKNSQTVWNRYFSRFAPLDNININNFISVFLSMVYSIDARRGIAKLMDDFKPDIVHIHNIYSHISPSILYEIKKRNIPCVYTLHDYHLITPNYIFFHNGKICEKIKGGNYFGAMLHRCVRGSLPGSVLTTTVFMIHSILGSYSKNVDLFICHLSFKKQDGRVCFDTKNYSFTKFISKVVIKIVATPENIFYILVNYTSTRNIHCPCCKNIASHKI
jgi:glycosyltransferase involved in cell wall biosynthesis